MWLLHKTGGRARYLRRGNSTDYQDNLYIESTQKKGKGIDNIKDLYLLFADSFFYFEF
jgi:hypothetical protein